MIVSMPIRASLHFHEYRGTFHDRELIVSMPIRASLHFHIIYDNGSIELKHCVNAHSGFSAFPRIHMTRVKSAFECQCPFGLLFISTKITFQKSKNDDVCQCPFGLLFISTFICSLQDDKNFKSVNAHSGFSSFPRVGKSGCVDAYLNSVNAHSGFSSFPRKEIPIPTDCKIMCQCPFGLLFISTKRTESL